MGIVRINELPEGSGNLTNDDIFIFMDDPSGGGVTKKISLSEISNAIGVGSPSFTVINLGSVSGNINTDASSGGIFDLTLTGSGLLTNPTNPTNGQTLRWRIRQDNTGNRILSLGNKFKIPSSATNPLPFSGGSGVMDILGATYHAGRDKWDIVAFVPGY
jgi:hypothetical protein